MKYIKQFNEFLEESFLNGSRQPLYHHTSIYNLINILKDDMLKIHEPSYGYKNKNGIIKCVCLTRTNLFTGGISRGVRLILDSDKLRNDGYKIKPIDELGLAAIRQKEKNINKWNYIYRCPKHNIDNLNIDDVVGMDNEYEERCYENIKNLGKYIINIQINSNNYTEIKQKEIFNFINKYPHIKLEIYDNEDNFKIINSDIIKQA